MAARSKPRPYASRAYLDQLWTFVLTASLYGLRYEFEDKGPRGGQCIERDAHREQDPRGTTIELGLRLTWDLSAVHDGRGREEFKVTMLRSSTSNKVTGTASKSGTLGVKSTGDYIFNCVRHAEPGLVSGQRHPDRAERRLNLQ